jgi:hypothetical protein
MIPESWGGSVGEFIPGFWLSKICDSKTAYTTQFLSQLELNPGLPWQPLNPRAS